LPEFSGLVKRVVKNLLVQVLIVLSLQPRLLQLNAHAADCALHRHEQLLLLRILLTHQNVVLTQIAYHH
jgi:hypothetical protein